VSSDSKTYLQRSEVRDSPDLERLVGKLQKINAALMNRVERSMDQQANAYSLFQTAIGLESQVRVRTEELKSALSRLEVVNEELRDARDASDRVNRFKTRFFTAVGHDLLQPLHAARLSLSALTELAVDRDQRRIAEQIDHALSSVDELLRSILDISKLEAGFIKPNLQVVALNEVFASLENDMQPLSRDRRLSLTYRATDLAVTSDPLMLRRVLQNLAANAVRYTQHGRILIGARHRGAQVRIEIWDTGPGIPETERVRIFEEFERGTSSQKSGSSGFGLGLAIVQRTAESLDHRVELCSKVGHGSRLSVVASYAGRARRQSSLVRPDGPIGEAYGFAGAHIVVIENDLAVVEAMRLLLSRWSCRVSACTDLVGIEEIVAGHSAPPSLVIADYHLESGEVGLTGVARLRAAYSARLPAIVVTADHSQETADEVHRAACEILRKPVRPAELRALMQHMLK